MTISPTPRPYVADKPSDAPSSEDLRSRIPGWGVDLDHADRPSVPRENRGLMQGDGRLPERQPETRPRERSIEHAILPPVFGTVQPLHGLSGLIRRTAYARFSEGRAAHWLLLVLGDRVDVLESAGRSLVSRRPDNPLLETGLSTEVTHNGLRSRREGKRVDLVHQALDPVLVAGPWLLGGWLLVRAARGLQGRRR